MCKDPTTGAARVRSWPSAGTGKQFDGEAVRGAGPPCEAEVPPLARRECEVRRVRALKSSLTGKPCAAQARRARHNSHRTADLHTPQRGPSQILP